MPVRICLRGNETTPEYKDGVVLKEIFESSFPNSVNGEILIISNATLFGQETKDVDLIAIGKFENFSTTIKSKAKTKDGLEDQSDRLVYFNDFCFVFETKTHRAEDIKIDGTTLLVRYNSRLHDVTIQSENQKYSLMNYFKESLRFSPYICNFIWLRSVSAKSIKNLLGRESPSFDKHNYLPNVFSLKWLLQLACVQWPPYRSKDSQTGRLRNSSSFSSLNRNQNLDFDEVNRMFEIFTRVKEGMGDLTRRKIEQITKVLLKDQKYAQAIGEKLVIISGRAGTGKTIKLLTIACNLAEQNGARCLILTYNHALVSDIKRTLALADIPDSIDDYTVNITTLHKFFYEVLLGFEIGVQRTKNDNLVIPNYLTRYPDLLKELYEYIEHNLIQKKDLETLIRTRHQQIAWDFLLIDEAQDWDEVEKKLLFFLFGKERIIIADGVDQLVRSQKNCNWKDHLKKDLDFRQTSERKGLRQKTNVLNFVLQVAEKLGVNWDLEPKEDLYGGKVIVKVGNFSKEIYEREFTICTEQGNAAYEMLFLVPPSLVNRAIIKDNFGKEVINRSFVKAEEFREYGISVWDGTSTDLRTSYAVDIKQHRVLQYDSCRGLEGWVVVCMDLDEFVQYKHDTYSAKVEETASLMSFEERRARHVNLWTLLPLTRAIDTLIITIKNPNSHLARKLREVYQSNQDYVEWIEN